MKPYKFILAVLAYTAPATAQMFNEATTAALETCFDTLWTDEGKFGSLPRAAITVFPGYCDDTTTTVLWNVMWNDPTTRAAGNCIVQGNEIISFEDYTK